MSYSEHIATMKDRLAMLRAHTEGTVDSHYAGIEAHVKGTDTSNTADSGRVPVDTTGQRHGAAH